MKQKIKLWRFLKGLPKFSLRERKRSETKVAEEYCWAITQAAGWLYGGRSGTSVLVFGFQLGSFLDHMCIKTRLAPDVPERN